MFDQILPTLTKTLILETISQENIFARFGLEVTNKHIKNPLRDDKKASCYFYKKNNGVIYFVDRAGGFHWDCFNYVSMIFSCSFYQSLVIIANSFNIDYLYKKELDVKPLISYKQQSFENITRDELKKTITFKYEGYNENTLKYWKRYEISKNTLIKYLVYPILTLSINNKEIYYYNKEDICYAYRLGQFDYKVYFPYRENNKWITNCDKNVVQGLFQLTKEPSNLLFITKSLKDVMCLSEMGYNAIAPQSETCFPEDIIENLKKQFKYIIIFYDNDKTGKKYADFYANKYNLTTLYTPDENTKDISDFIEYYGIDEAYTFIEQSIYYGR